MHSFTFMAVTAISIIRLTQSCALNKQKWSTAILIMTGQIDFETWGVICG